MKTQVFKITVSAVLILLLCGFSNVTAQEASRQVKKEYKADKGFTLGVENKYGKIEVVNWDQDKIDVVVTVESKAGSQDRADYLLDIVNIDISEESNAVYLETEYDMDKKKNKENIKVSYMIKAPSYINANLEQKYGSIFVQEITGNANFEIKYGNLTATSLVNAENKWNNVEIAYGDANIETASLLAVELAYGALVVSESDELSVESKYSKLSLGRVGILDLESKYDKVKMDVLNESISVESDYTQLNLGKVSADFKAIDAEMTYGNMKGELESGASFTVNADIAYGNINLPDGDFEKSKHGQRIELSGKVGKGSGAYINVSIKYGNLDLK